MQSQYDWSIKDEWSELWTLAYRNMPYKVRVLRDPVTKKPRFREHIGRGYLLRLLLNYKCFNDDGRALSHSLHVRTAIARGDKPRDAKRQRLLRLLASNHSSTVIKAIAAKRGLDLSKYEVWPK